jgi:site-specific DNA recombinase
MSQRKNVKPAEVRPKLVRCAIYTRKSTEEGLEQAFNTLDAQREAGEACVAAQRHEGWVCLPDRYDDGGYSGGTIDRPALRRMMADIEAGKIDCVVVYKVDRLSRSLLDFSRVMGVFESKNVSFVSVTQQFNTAHSMGRLMLNVLLSFAQFEREIISERTRDKIAAARRKGKWAGGKPLLGYDLASSAAGGKLAVNEAEAERVRQIFQLYLKHEAMLPVVKVLAQRGWTTKVWTTRAGEAKGGRPLDKGALYKLLTNRAYTGVVTHHGQHYPGEHPAIVAPAVFERVNAILKRNGHRNGAQVRNKHGALLRGVLACGCCDCGMAHSYSQKAGSTKRYRYYVCTKAQKNGWHTCQTKSVPAAQIEAYVVEQVKKAAQDPAVLEATLRQVQAQHEKEVTELRGKQRAAEREVARARTAVGKAVSSGDVAGVSQAEERLQSAERALGELQERTSALAAKCVSRDEVRAALASFSPAWEQLTPREQERVIRLLIERVSYDGGAGTISITFRPTGIKSLAGERGAAA